MDVGNKLGQLLQGKKLVPKNPACHKPHAAGEHEINCLFGNLPCCSLKDRDAENLKHSPINTHTQHLAAYDKGVVAPLPLLTNDSVQLGVQSLRQISNLGEHWSDRGCPYRNMIVN